MHRKISKGTEQYNHLCQLGVALGVGVGGEPTLHLIPLYFWICFICMFYYIGRIIFFK